LISSRFTGDENTFIWLLGDNAIGVVNPATLVYDLVANFFGKQAEAITPFAMIACQPDNKYMGLFVKDDMVHFSFMRGGGELVRVLVAEVLEESNSTLKRR